MKKNKCITIYDTICILNEYWKQQGCTILQPLDLPIGAGTFHKETFFNTIDKNKNNVSIAYIQPCRRPSDGRYANNSNRLQYYYQYQVIIKPPPTNIQNLFIKSLQRLTINPKYQDIRFVEDNWENPTLGASGVGWEVWINGMEVTQFTYFQHMGGIECNPITVEITYGLERISMHLQKINNILNLIWTKNKKKTITYSDIFYKNEYEQSHYNFIYSNTNILFKLFNIHIKAAKELILLKNPLVIPAYEHILQAIHNFNLLDSKKVLSVSERQNYIFTIRNLIKNIATIFHNQ